MGAGAGLGAGAGTVAGDGEGTGAAAGAVAVVSSLPPPPQAASQSADKVASAARRSGWFTNGSFGPVRALRDGLERYILDMTPHAVVIAQDVDRLANTCCVALPGTLAETLVIKLDLAGVSISAGSACSSGKVGASHVLAAMHVPEALVSSAIRISLGPETSNKDIAAFLSAWGHVASRAGKAA